MIKKILILVVIAQAMFTQNIFANKKSDLRPISERLGIMPQPPKQNLNYSKFNGEKKVDISIEDIFKLVEENKNSYENKNYNLEKKSLDTLIKDNKLGDFNGINISSNLSYLENVFPKNYTGKKPENYKHYNRFLQNKLSYGIFFVNFNYDFNRENNQNNYISYGIEKNLKDLFYSKHKTALRKNNLKKDINEIKLKKAMINKKTELLDLYKKIFEVKDEIKLKSRAYEVYKKEYENQKKSYDLGTNSKINLEAVQYEVESISLDLEILKENLDTLYRVGKLNYNIDLKSYNLLEIQPKFSVEELIKSYKKDEVEEAKINLAIGEEEKKYSKYDSVYPDVYLKYERVDKNINGSEYYKDRDIFSLSFSKKLFGTNSEYKLTKIQEESLKNLLEEKIKNIEIEKIEIKQDYERLLKNLEVSNKKLNLEKKKYDIKKLKYKLDKASYLDVLDSYNIFLKQEIDTNRIKNELNTFIYKIMIRS